MKIQFKNACFDDEYWTELCESHGLLLHIPSRIKQLIRMKWAKFADWYAPYFINNVAELPDISSQVRTDAVKTILLVFK